jgi:predicted Zn-dependent peptidase
MITRSLARTALALAAATLALSTVLSAVTPPSVKFTDTKLKNGLRLIVSEDHTAPTFSIAVIYNVGSRNERPGRTGFAHLFEHMMFKGSENVGPGEHFYTVFANGGSMNGTTNKERTLYFETMPANQLEAAIFLEADRMRSLAITRDNLDNQRNAVQEERRLGLDNQPYGRTNELFDELGLDNPAYEHSVIGSMQDLNAASVEDVAAFFKTYYAPNNAIVSIVGDVNPARVRELAARYFETIPAQPPPPAVDISQPAQTAERRQVLDDPLARLPRIDIGYRIPSTLSPDDDTIDVLTLVLSGGQASRFNEVIVRQKQLAANVNAFAGTSRGPRLLRIVATPIAGKSVEDVEGAVYAEIERLKAGPIADWEIEKARNTARRNFVGGLQSSLNRAVELAEYALTFDNPGRINTEFQRLDKLTAADIQRIAKQYLTPENRTVIVTRPKGAAGPGAR